MYLHITARTVNDVLVDTVKRVWIDLDWPKQKSYGSTKTSLTVHTFEGSFFRVFRGKKNIVMSALKSCIISLLDFNIKYSQYIVSTSTGDTSLHDFGYKYLLLLFIILIFDIFSQIFQQSRVQSLPRKCCVLQPKTKRGEKNETAFCWQSNWGCSKTLQHRY